MKAITIHTVTVSCLVFLAMIALTACQARAFGSDWWENQSDPVAVAPVKRQVKPQVRGFVQRLPAPPKPDTRCKPVISAIGDSAKSEAAARLEAQKSVKARIQFEYGNKFLALENGEDLEYQCGPSSVPRFGGTVEAAASRFLPLESITCKINVRPCESPVTRETGK